MLRILFPKRFATSRGRARTLDCLLVMGEIDIPKSDIVLSYIMTLPVVIAFSLLAFGASEVLWLYWLLLIGGWYLSKLIWWHLYRFYVLKHSPPRRTRFYVNCSLAQLVFCVAVIMYAVQSNHG